MIWPCILPPGVWKLIFQHFSTFPEEELLRCIQGFPPWHRHIPCRSKMFCGQGWLKKPCRYTSKAETEFTMCRQGSPPPTHPVQHRLAHLLQLPPARVHDQVHLDLAARLYQVPPLSRVPGHRKTSSRECRSKVLLRVPEKIKE